MQAVYGTVSGLTISSGLDEKQKEAAEAFTAFLSQPKVSVFHNMIKSLGTLPKKKGESDVYKTFTSDLSRLRFV
ncbi:hypothetical protein EfmAA610_29620 [Enterococcus faecium]|nr:hypothetical protein EfmAA610_29620 [Enterococcus faecium]